MARAEGPLRLSLTSAGDCPTVADVIDELRLLLPDAVLEPALGPTPGDVVVTDQGESFMVSVRGQRRRFRELKRDCTERARHVAVFTVLVVDPLHVPVQTTSEPEVTAETLEKSPEVATVVAPAAAQQSEPRGSHFELSLGPLAQAALRNASESATQAGGLGLRLRYGGTIGVTLGVAGLLPTSLHFNEAEARATWFPIDLGLSLSKRFSSWETALEVGFAGALLLVEGQALDVTERAVRFEYGGRAGVQVRYWASERAGIFAGMSASWFPEPYTLQVEGIGAVGQTPSGWIGGSLGAVIRL